jgi:hypothetical protein
VALRPALSLRFALIGESILKELSPTNLPAGAGSTYQANIRSYGIQPSCQQLAEIGNTICMKKLAECDGILMTEDDRFFQAI